MTEKKSVSEQMDEDLALLVRTKYNMLTILHSPYYQGVPCHISHVVQRHWLKRFDFTQLEEKRMTRH